VNTRARARLGGDFDAAAKVAGHDILDDGEAEDLSPGRTVWLVNMGSKMWGMTAGSIPLPWSATESRICPFSLAEVQCDPTPPLATLASIALVTRLVTTWASPPREPRSSNDFHRGSKYAEQLA